MVDIELSHVRDQINAWKNDGVDPVIIYVLDQLADAVGQLKHDYNICHSDAMANAEYASFLERQLYKS